jgi:hypothetical protein
MARTLSSISFSTFRTSALTTIHLVCVEVAALFYSLIESAKLGGVEPKAYLLHATRAALASPGTVTLPHALLTS